MRIIILNQFFYPDHSATSQLMTELAESMVEQGIEVTALSGRGRYNGGERLASGETYKGVKIRRAWATSFGKKHLWGRLLDYVSFYLGAIWKLLWMPRHDVILALTTPPLIGLVAVIVGHLRRMRVVILVQDIYPDIAVALGALPEKGRLTRLLHRLNSWMLRHADGIIALSECMRRRIAAVIGNENASQIEVIHNWADGRRIQPLDSAKAENAFAIEHQLQDSFVLLFSGNWGQVNEFPTVLEAANLLRDRSDIVFLFIGDGAKGPEIRQFCQQHELTNVRLMPYLPREYVPLSLAACDVALVTLGEGLAGLSVPSKTYAILAAGRPVLFVGDLASDIANIVTETGCGAAVAAGQSRDLADLIVEWANDPGMIQQLGERARTIFESRYDRTHAVGAYIDALQKFARRSPQPESDRKPNEIALPKKPTFPKA